MKIAITPIKPNNEGFLTILEGIFRVSKKQWCNARLIIVSELSFTGNGPIQIAKKWMK